MLVQRNTGLKTMTITIKSNLVTRIPFAIHVPTQTYVDVDEVDSGAKCNCICPSCQSQLIAKHGTKKIHHFAHLKSNVKADCKYSLFFSIRMMYLKLLTTKSNISILIPGYQYHLNTETRYGQPITIEQSISKEYRTTLLDIKTDCYFKNSLYDVIAKTEHGYIAIQFNYDERPIELHQNEYGLAVISLNIMPLSSLLLNKSVSLSNNDLLLNYMQHDNANIQWVFKPLPAGFEADSQNKLREKTIESEHQLERTFPHAQSCLQDVKSHPNGVTKTISTFTCSQCENEWNAVHGFLCPKCRARAKK